MGQAGEADGGGRRVREWATTRSHSGTVVARGGQGWPKEASCYCS